VPSAEVAVGEIVELVGYGVGYSATRPGQQTSQLRRVGTNVVKDKQTLALPESLKVLVSDAEKIVLDGAGALTLGGDSGGPCLRRVRKEKGDDTLVLVGISSWSTGSESVFVSAYFHQKWLGERRACSRSESCRLKVMGEARDR
jgi:hypothetical protein